MDEPLQTYHSSTLGPITISFTGRSLLHTLREAIVDAIFAGNYNAHGDAVSLARARLARYISTLEKYNASLRQQNEMHRIKNWIRRQHPARGPLGLNGGW